MSRIPSAPTLGLAALLGVACAPGFAIAQEAAAAARSLPQVEVTDDAPSPNGRLDLDTPPHTASRPALPPPHTPSDTASRLGLTPRETPASVTVVDRSVIDARGAQNTQEILRAIPGVTAHDAPGSIGVSYRGFGAGSIGQMFNGINVQYSI